MAKKFGKFLFFAAAVGSAAAAAAYYLKKKDDVISVPEDEDYDDFSEDLEEEASASRSYVPLKSHGKTAEADKAQDKEQKDDSFTPLEKVIKPAADTAEEAAETVEEFFDEEDNSDEEPPITDTDETDI
jgi:hypothetical protein